MMSSRQNRKARRAAERAATKQITPDCASVTEPRTLAIGGHEPTPESKDEAAVFSEPKIQLDEAAVFSEPKIQRGPARLAANRANAQFSSGPISEAGKAKSSMNALKTALTGRTVLLPTDDADRYERHLHEYKKAYQPVGERECELVQSLADTTWRLDRIPGLEEALYFKGSTEFAAQVAELDPRLRSTMLRMRTYLAYERQLRNLNLQEMRLHRLREKLIAEIKQLQKEREQKERDDLSIAAKLYVAARHDRQPFDPAKFGFEFSTQDVEAFLHGQRASFLTEKAMTGSSRV
jgi:hypothetical protein